jgi:drug/metabolite transporter (DMT)-like permease
LLSIGILLALFCAFATNVGFLLKHRGACAAPDVSLKHPVASAIGLFRSKWFAIGMLVALGAWVFHVAALAMAPLSVVQAVIAGGLVFLTVLAERYFGCSVGTRQWAGVGLTALGLVLLAVTLPLAAVFLSGWVMFHMGDDVKILRESDILAKVGK